MNDDQFFFVLSKIGVEFLSFCAWHDHHGPSCGPAVMSCPIMVSGQTGHDRVSGQKFWPDNYLGHDQGI